MLRVFAASTALPCALVYTSFSSFVRWYRGRNMRGKQKVDNSYSYRFNIELLRFMTRLEISFNPILPGNTTIREFMSHVHSKKCRAANPNCQVLVNMHNSSAPPRVVIEYIDGTTQTIETTTLSFPWLNYRINTKTWLLELVLLNKDLADGSIDTEDAV